MRKQRLAFSRRELKMLAKRLMFHPICMRVTLLLVGLQVSFVGLRYLLGATLTYGMASLAQYGDTVSGIYFNSEGFSILFRMDLTQMVLAIPVTYAQLIRFVVFSVVVLLILAPIRLGVMEQYWSMLRGSGEAGVRPVLRWFRQGGKFGKAVVVELLLGAGVRLAGILATVPSLYLFYLFYTTTPSMAAYTTTSSLLQIGATVLAIAALVFTFWLHSIFLPVRYCLCAHPEYSLGQVFRRGLDSAKGFRGAFFGFRLSYILWFLVSQVTYGAMDIFVTPYTSLGGMLFLQEAARARQGEATPQQEEQDPPQGLE